MQSTALALISCEQTRGEIVHTEVPRYDAIIYCDLGIEPAWVPEQVKFIEAACRSSGIPFYILRSDLYRDYMKNFGVNRVSAMPFWTINEEGEAGRIARRSCTVDYKIVMIQKFVRYELLGYRPYQRLRPEDIGTHELHISSERKCQGLNAEKSKTLFCALFTKAVLPLQCLPPGQAPAAPARHTFPQGCRAGTRLPTSVLPVCPPRLSR